MTIKKIFELIREVANDQMTEDGIHHDDWSDLEREYISEIINNLKKSNE